MKVLVSTVKLLAFGLVACSQVFGVVRGYECDCAGPSKPVASSDCVVSECHDGRPHEDGCRSEEGADDHAGVCADDHSRDQPAHDGSPCSGEDGCPPTHSHKHEHREVRETIKARGASVADWLVAPPEPPATDLPDFLAPAAHDPRLAPALASVPAARRPGAHPPPDCCPTSRHVTRSIVLLF